jgi:hypothetical protein
LSLLRTERGGHTGVVARAVHYGADVSSAATFADHVEMYLGQDSSQNYQKRPANTDIDGPDHGRVERLFLQGVVDNFTIYHGYDRRPLLLLPARPS